MVDMGNDRHVTDVGLLVHDLTDLVHCKVHLQSMKQIIKISFKMVVVVLNTYINFEKWFATQELTGVVHVQ